MVPPSHSTGSGTSSITTVRVSSPFSSDAVDAVPMHRSVSSPLGIDPRLLPVPSSLPGSVTVYEQITSSSGDQTTTRVVTYVVNNAGQPYSHSLMSPRSASHLHHNPFMPALPSPQHFTHTTSDVSSLSRGGQTLTQPASHSLHPVASSPAIVTLHSSHSDDAVTPPPQPPSTLASRPKPLLSPSEESTLIEEHHLFSPSTSQPASRYASNAPSPTSATASFTFSDMLSPASDGAARNLQSLHRRRPGYTADSEQASHDTYDGSGGTSSVYSDGEGVHDIPSDTPAGLSRLKRSNDPTNSTAAYIRNTLSSLHSSTRKWEKALFDRYLPVLSPSSTVRTHSLPLAFVLLVLILTMAWWAGWLLSLQSVEVALPITPQSAASSSALLWGEAALSSPRGNTSLPVHLIAACVNRLSSLRTSLPTWLAVRELSSVTVVDWGSDEPLHERLADDLEMLDGRLRIVRLTQKRDWMLPTAVNLALHFVPLDTPSLLLKVDCDTQLHFDFVRQHPLSKQRFYAGDWRVARDENEVHLNGVLLIHTADLLRVNGYDERLQSYGYDDTNLHDRLIAANLTAQPLRYQFIQHLQHDDTLRRTGKTNKDGKASSAALSVAAFNSPSLLTLDQLVDIAPPFFALQLHRLLLDAVPRWNTSMAGSSFHIQAGDAPHVYHATLQRLPTRLDDVVGQTTWLSAVRQAAEITLRRFGVRVDELPKLDEAAAVAHYLMRLVAFWSSDSERPSLVIHVQHGLSNRLRGLASAAAVASALHMPLKVIWLPDHHCAARFSQLFRVRHEIADMSVLNESLSHTSISQLGVEHVWEDLAFSPAVHLLDADKYDLYNYMEPEPQAVKDKPIVSKDGKDWRGIYVKSAYRLAHEAAQNDYNLHFELSSLILSEPVLALLDSLQKPSVSRGVNGAGIEASSISIPALEPLVGVHIRQRSPESEIAELKPSEYPPAGWSALEQARAESTVDAYAPSLEAGIYRDVKQRFFISSDTPDVLREVRDRFGSERITYFVKDECNDRSVRCTQQALVDQLMLAQTARLVGSVWSSFSEIAALWRLRPIEYPAEVQQLVDAKFTQVQNEERRKLTLSKRPWFLTSQLLDAPFSDERIAEHILPPEERTSGCRIELFSILGERCSGTSYLQRLIEGNFDANSTDDYHYRHFFGFEQVKFPYKKAQCVLFVGVVRAPVAWLDCFYKYQWQLDQWQYPDWPSFLSNPIRSYRESEMNYTLSLLAEEQRAAARDEMLEHPLFHDRNFVDPQLANWQDVFELRRVKAAYMTGKFRSKVKNYVMVRLEDLQTHYKQFLHILQLWFNVQPRHSDQPQLIDAHSPMPDYSNAEMDRDVSEDLGPLHGNAHQHVTPELHNLIWQKLDRAVEKKMGYTEERD